ncbi:type IV secretory pathway, VirD4 component [Bifidobacterium saguini DSM 23967]|uniref:Type IV secretory pathway, VirD4 component n=2 Tax=Bifidobacterium saguini TaxID=762210 RepID=A0A087DE67_9BIFI|nr:type IV secretory system conjugative DNA transfer family protein [Bifidobacterium saguini]KFI93817.1 type IV secretory pathway, VirD4 component [Bifidobacterium saguini DSM 23967]QTB91557.1 type IV secretory system conjugative DNA transfer family protein [Bifidobacterium saguini]
MNTFVNTIDSSALGERILAAGLTASNNTLISHLNNNDLIIGPSGAGKTRGYVKPNLLQMNESVIVTDTKGNLVREIGPVLAAHGYRVVCVDFTDLAGWGPSPVCNTPGTRMIGYNPLDFIRTHPDGEFNEQDVVAIASAISPVENNKDPFWDQAGAMYLSAFIAYTMQCLPKKEQNLATVQRMVSVMNEGSIPVMMDEMCQIDPQGMTARRWRAIQASQRADKMDSSIRGILESKLAPMAFRGATGMFTRSERIDFAKLGRGHWAVFVNVSDTDRSMDRMVNLFYTQALQQLCRFADTQCDGNRLPVPVRMYLDDFATNCRIPDFDKVIAVIRSRGISVSVILQSLTQLESMYGAATAASIANNCDHWLYLGGQDTDTARQISLRVGCDPGEVMRMPLDCIYVFERGCEPELATPYDIATHPLYSETPEGRRVTRAAEDAVAAAERILAGAVRQSAAAVRDRRRSSGPESGCGY